MTNEEAVKILKGAIKKPNTKDGYLGQALTMAIEALEQTELNPSYNSVKTELEPCEDWKFYYKHGYAQARNDVLDKIRTEITDWQTDIHDNENDAEIYDFVFERIYEIFDEYKNRK